MVAWIRPPLQGLDHFGIVTQGDALGLLGSHRWCWEEIGGFFHDLALGGVFLAEVGLDAADGEVHDGEVAGGGVALLAVDGEVARLATMRFDELFRLH